MNTDMLSILPKQDKEYFNTYFRISSGYVWGEGLPPEQTEKFFSEMKKLFSNAGWEVQETKFSSGCPSVVKGKNSLYCHPMNLSGPCQPAVIPEVLSILANAKACRLCGFDTHQQIFDLSEEEYLSVLEQLKPQIEEDILTCFHIAEGENPVHKWMVLDTIGEKYWIPTLNSYLIRSSDDIAERFADDLICQLTKDGKLKKNRNNLFVTTGSPAGKAPLNAKLEDASQRTSSPLPKTGDRSPEKGVR